jgi:hypothetical protein
MKSLIRQVENGKDILRLGKQSKLGANISKVNQVVGDFFPFFDLRDSPRTGMQHIRNLPVAVP